MGPSTCCVLPGSPPSLLLPGDAPLPLAVSASERVSGGTGARRDVAAATLRCLATRVAIAHAHGAITHGAAV